MSCVNWNGRIHLFRKMNFRTPPPPKPPSFPTPITSTQCWSCAPNPIPQSQLLSREDHVSSRDSIHIIHACVQWHSQLMADGPTPPGWERKKDPKGFIFWVNHAEKKVYLCVYLHLIRTYVGIHMCIPPVLTLMYFLRSPTPIPPKVRWLPPAATDNMTPTRQAMSMRCPQHRWIMCVCVERNRKKCDSDTLQKNA